MAATSTMLPLGTPAPPFTLEDPRGGTHSLADAAGAPATVVMFICNHCPYVIHIREALAEVTGRFIDQGVAVFGIQSNDADAYPDDGPDRMVEEAEAIGYRFPYLYDADQSAARAYRAACTPDLFVFDAAHRLAYRGQFDATRPSSGESATGEDLVRAVEAVLAGESPDPDQQPSMGCSIKWRPGNEPSP
jgi:peroxiredoxin